MLQRSSSEHFESQPQQLWRRRNLAFATLVVLTLIYSVSLSATPPSPTHFRRLSSVSEIFPKKIRFPKSSPRPRAATGSPSHPSLRQTLTRQGEEALSDGLDRQRVAFKDVSRWLALKKFENRARQVRSVEHMRRLLDKLPLSKLSVKGHGDTADHLHSHPVLKLMRDRVEKGYRPGMVRDGAKIALAVEGGGMRGAVGAGMALAVSVLGLNNAIDCVYGSSAGSIVGAYFISRQWQGTRIYRDLLPCAKEKFLDLFGICKSLVPARGLDSPGSLDLSGSHPIVFNLTFLLEEVMGGDGLYPLDWETFERNNAHQPLHIVASAPLTRRSVALSQQRGNFRDLPEMFSCMRASMCVPGLAGPPQYLDEKQQGILHKLGGR